MEGLKRDALVLRLIAQLREDGSWCGETHIQKAVFFLQSLFVVPLGFEFVLYKYGPFSFDLRDALTAMRADGLLDLRARQPYGPTLLLTEDGAEFPKKFPVVVGRYEPQIVFIGGQLGSYKVHDLERLATALYVKKKHGEMGMGDVAVLVHELKPHVRIDDAVAALREVERIVGESASVS